MGSDRSRDRLPEDARDDRASESIEVHTSDGHVLRAIVTEAKRGERARGVAVLAHAMFARKSEWDRRSGKGKDRRGPSLARFLSDRGWRTIAFDFRGHGESGPGAASGAAWTYEDLVVRDLPAVVDGARSRARGRKVIVVGHSLGGHVAAAAQATGTIDVDGIGLLASNVWLEAIEPSRARSLVKRGVMRTVDAICRRRGYFPARLLGLGSDDESAAYMAAIGRATERGFWGSEDGHIDYWDELRHVAVPLFALASDGDPLNAHPDCVARFALRAKGRVTIDRIRASDDGSAAPGHMEMVTTERSLSAWGRLEAWMRG